ncbi:MAG TPA: tRNA uridine-5-carboxymethylaminomethyl(34) synthesis GTPase MnmE [Saprospiraceae bacterium]|nr:tRNA uridine-5-carboxymethylaminomethyl(34) synthesis GTPase MnmE [Saprospiraceae bacterium]
MKNEDTIVAHATASGQAAISIIRLSGTHAILIVNTIFEGADLSEAEGFTKHYGWIRDDDDKLIDEVLVSVFRNPVSYTGEDVVEISCHGSMYIVRRILELCVESGARLAKPGEFTMRAFLNGKMDLSQAESVADIIASESSAAHALAINQMRGGVSDQIKMLRRQLVDLASLLELELDFSEEDVEFADRTKLKDLVSEIRHAVSQLMESFRLGNAIKNGIVTVIAGRPNAGKSTLLNALLNEERAIVSPIPGTTRDTIEEVIHIDGIAFRLIDTAGIREAQDQIESLGVARTMQKIGESAILVYVFDVTQTSREELHPDIKSLVAEWQKGRMAEGVAAFRPSALPPFRLVLVPNKMDLNPYIEKSEWTGNGITEDMIVPMSALNNMNTGYLREKLVHTVKSENLPAGLPVISSARHYEALLHVDESLEAVSSGLTEGITTDMIAADLRHALYWLGSITGEVSNDELLGNIFGKFCIGK